LRCWTSWRTWSAVWRMTTQHIRGEQWPGAFSGSTQRGPFLALLVAHISCVLKSSLLAGRNNLPVLELCEYMFPGIKCKCRW
jgi:hypothetical protein